jgi:hypothetical protein
MTPFPSLGFFRNFLHIRRIKSDEVRLRATRHRFVPTATNFANLRTFRLYRTKTRQFYPMVLKKKEKNASLDADGFEDVEAGVRGGYDQARNAGVPVQLLDVL